MISIKKIDEKVFSVHNMRGSQAQLKVRLANFDEQNSHRPPLKRRFNSWSHTEYDEVRGKEDPSARPTHWTLQNT